MFLKQKIQNNMSNLLSGKTGLIMGIANEMSIAWHIANACKANGAELCLTYPNQTMESRVTKLGQELGCQNLFECDVSSQESIQKACDAIKQKYGKLDFIVHAVAFSDKNELKGRYVDTSAENFANTMNISCYSLTAVTRHLAPIMKDGGSILTLSYYGAEKAIPNYNVMGVAKAALETSVKYLALDLGVDGIRVNAISAGPIRTLAAAGISDFRRMLNWSEKNTPLRRNVTGEDIGGAAVFLLSNASSGVTGEIMHVDCGYHAVGMKLEDDEK
jgi:enoyl-[acyl-carrier protein] reductase I